VSVEPVPRREMVIRSPKRTRRPTVSVPLPGSDDQAAFGAAQLRSLMRSQLRSSLFSFAVLAVPTALLPLVFAVLAPSGGWLSGPALAWIILGFAGYPPMVLLGWRYVRRAERHERDFERLVKGC
jgi:hypothetical protein